MSVAVAELCVVSYHFLRGESDIENGIVVRMSFSF